MSSGHNLELTIPAHRFNDLSAALDNFNRRTTKVNAERKRKKYQKVTRYPINHNTVKRTVTVRIEIEDRSKVLFQELTEIVERFRKMKDPKKTFGVWIACASESEATVVAGVLKGAVVEAR